MFVFFIIIGLLGFIYGLYSINALNSLHKNGIEVDGIILSYESDWEGNQIPIILFKTLDDEEIHKKPNYYSSSDLGKFIVYDNNIQKKVAIIYHPKNPRIFAVKDEEMNYLGIIFLLVVGFILIIIGIINYLYY